MSKCKRCLRSFGKSRIRFQYFHNDHYYCQSCYTIIAVPIEVKIDEHSNHETLRRSTDSQYIKSQYNPDRFVYAREFKTTPTNLSPIFLEISSA